MDLNSWILQQHLAAHTILDQEIAKTNASTMCVRPEGAANSPAWLIWHVTRCEDLAVNAIVRGVPQVLALGKWRDAGLADSRIGTGFSDDEVAAFSHSVEPSTVLDYRQAVIAETRRWIRKIEPSMLDAKPDLDARLATAGDLWPEAGSWPREMWASWPAGVFINVTAIGHTLVHTGELQSVLLRMGVHGR